MIKAILFDLDNTLVDFMTMKIRCCEAAIDAMLSSGLNMEREDALKILFDLYEIHGIEQQHIFEKFFNALGGKIEYKYIAHGIVAYRKAREHYLKLYPRVVPTLLALKKNYKLAIVSDAPILQAHMRLVMLNIDDFFDVVVTAADVRKQKTTAAPFNAALRELGVKPNEAMMVGDRVERDVNTAKKLGLRTCYARYGERRIGKTPKEKGKSGADYELEDISELVEIMNKLRVYDVKELNENSSS